MTDMPASSDRSDRRMLADMLTRRAGELVPSTGSGRRPMPLTQRSSLTGIVAPITSQPTGEMRKNDVIVGEQQRPSPRRYFARHLTSTRMLNNILGSMVNKENKQIEEEKKKQLVKAKNLVATRTANWFRHSIESHDEKTENANEMKKCEVEIVIDDASSTNADVQCQCKSKRRSRLVEMTEMSVESAKRSKVLDLIINGPFASAPTKLRRFATEMTGAKLADHTAAGYRMPQAQSPVEMARKPGRISEMVKAFERKGDNGTVREKRKGDETKASEEGTSREIPVETKQAKSSCLTPPSLPSGSSRSPSPRQLLDTDLLSPSQSPRSSPRRIGRTRTESMINSSPLNPVLEDPTSILMERPNRRRRAYAKSHTTSTYTEECPDDSPRRQLIGFLHRTSHLSLTSNLSTNASFYLIGHRSGGRRFEDSTITSESDARIYSDEDDRVSTSTDITSVSRQAPGQQLYRRRQRNRRKYRQPSRASSFSSITESSMSLNIITVTLNMDTVNFLGISIVGQSSTRGDSGIYVANIMKGGAVALDGRIEAGDMILQVNDISFENLSNDEAVDVLRQAVTRKGPIKLVVAKCWESGPKSCFTVPRHKDEPVRPIDTQAWIQHTNAMRGMPSIMEGAPTPIPGQYGRPPSSSTVTSNGSGQQTIVGPGVRLDTSSDKKKVVQAMALPNSGLDIKNRTWLKIPIPMSFLGSDLVEWLMNHVDGLVDRKDARRYAAELLKAKLILHVVNKITFTEQCYYVLGDECAEFARMRLSAAGGEEMTAGRSDAGGSVGPLPPPPAGLMPGAMQHRPWLLPPALNHNAPSMVSDYATMPTISPFPLVQQLHAQQHLSGMSTAPATPAMLAAQRFAIVPDAPHSQASSADGSSGSDKQQKRTSFRPLLPVVQQQPPFALGSSASAVAGPSSASIGLSSAGLDDLPQDLAASRQSFRIAMNNPCTPYEFFVDHL